MTTDEKPDKPQRPQRGFTLVVEVGRKVGDGLPDKATGAALMCYASGVDEAARRRTWPRWMSRAMARWRIGWPRATRSTPRNAS
jgi:hypothetical protein